MDISVGISLIALVMSLVINIGAIFFWSGRLSAIIDDIKEDLKRLEEKQREDFKRLEAKQDKHNNLVERMAIVEQANKSSHHRQDEFNERLNIIERKLS